MYFVAEFLETESRDDVVAQERQESECYDGDAERYDDGALTARKA